MRRVRVVDEAGSIVSGEWLDDGIQINGSVHDPESLNFLCPETPSKILGVGPNYVSNVESKGKEWPDSPADLLLFVKTVPNSLVSHGGTAILHGGGDFCHELEIGAVIDEQCRNLSVAEAEEVIRGFTCVNEITNMEVPNGKFDFDNRVRTKSFDNSSPVGPVTATPDEVPEDAHMELRVNGKVRQQTQRSNQIFTEAEIVAEISRYLTLEPGDIVATGSPTGVDSLRDGDSVEVSIEGIGTLRHDVVIGN